MYENETKNFQTVNLNNRFDFKMHVLDDSKTIEVPSGSENCDEIENLR